MQGAKVTANTTPGGWRGSVVTGPGLLEFSGWIGPAAAHAHAAVQVLLVSHGEVVLRDAADAERQVVSAVVPAGVRHGMFASGGGRGTITYLDPVSPIGRFATERVLETGLDIDGVDAWLVDVDVKALRADGSTAVVVHPAVTDALRLAPALADGPMLLAEIASRVGLSASRLGHLFAEQVGVPYPVWRRWLRLQLALTAIQGGASLTAAAHTAGFADSAHLTRSCRAMFGITPSDAARATGGPTATGEDQVSGYVQG
jgi:AraC-like DNA-binding protein